MNKSLQAKEILGKYISCKRRDKQFRLPAERVLAGEFGYSRGTIAKALDILEAEGIISRKRGSGTFIVHTEEERTLTIALAMRTAYHYSDVHFRLIVDEISKYAELNNIRIQIFDHLVDVYKKNPKKNPLMDAIKNGVIDGVLIISRMPISILNQISVTCPTVSINNILGDGNEVPCVSCDYFAAGFLAGKHLLDNGHRKVAYVTDDVTNPESAFEFSGLKLALSMGGGNLMKRDILNTKQYMNTFNKRVLNFFAGSEYTACFVRHVTYAEKMVSVLQKAQIKIPEQLSVIATGNYKNDSPNGIKLTVIDNKLKKMCRVGLQTLQGIINENKTQGYLKLLTPEIIEKDSVININRLS